MQFDNHMEKASALNILEKWTEFCTEVSSSRLAILRKAGEWYQHEREAVGELRELEASDGIFPEVQPEPDDSVGGDASTVYSRYNILRIDHAGTSHED